MTPRLLDLFCGAGGAAMGYFLAGFEVVGVDIKPQPHYPFAFILGDALDILARMKAGEKFLASDGRWYGIDDFTAIHASPPCQEYSSSRHLRNANAVTLGYELNIRSKLVDQMRQALLVIGKPWVIENVPGSPLAAATMLCGSMFGKEFLRHRWFEGSVYFWAPQECKHPSGFYNMVGGKIRGYGDYASDRFYQSTNGPRRREGYPGKVKGILVFDIDWMTVAEMCESVPPIYTEWIGKQFIERIGI